MHILTWHIHCMLFRVFLPDMNTSAVTNAVTNALPQSPGEACAIMEVVSGKVREFHTMLYAAIVSVYV